MLRKMRGFTLIEMLIVVAIIGILATLLIPNAMSALQKAKQKGTIKDVNTLATGIMDYVTDKGVAPTATGAALTENDALVTALRGFYLKTVPLKDQWGHFLYASTGKSCSSNAFGITLPSGQGDWGDDEFIVGSSGRDTDCADYGAWSDENPYAGLYEVSTMNDFNKEIVNWNGSLVVGPRAAGSTT